MCLAAIQNAVLSVLCVLQELLYLSAVLAMKKKNPPETVLEQLNDATETHFTALKVNHISFRIVNLFQSHKC